MQIGTPEKIAICELFHPLDRPRGRGPNSPQNDSSKQRGGLAGSGASATDGAAGGWRSPRRLADASRKQCGRAQATRVPTATWTSRILGDRATLSKTRNSGKVACELRPIGRTPVKDWALTPEGKSTWISSAVAEAETYRQLSRSRVIWPRLTSLRGNPSGGGFSSDFRNRTLQNAGEDSFAAIWDGRDDRRSSLFSSARQRCRPGCEFRRTDRAEPINVSDPNHGHIDERGLLRWRARSASA